MPGVPRSSSVDSISIPWCVCVASTIGRHVVGGERDVTIGQELAEDLGHHAASLCKLEDEVHVAGGLLFFLSSRFTLL